MAFPAPKNPQLISELWDDQADFNRLFRPDPPTDFAGRSAVTREMVLHLIHQAMQLLEATDWRAHRNLVVQENRAQVGNQLTDIHKYWITLCQLWGFDFDDMADLYWKKSMVCRQRHAEEWVRSIQQPTVILDLDNVLCDYIQGFGTWLMNNVLLTPDQFHQLRMVIDRRMWLDAQAIGLDPTTYQHAKHQFRTCGAKAYLPTMPGAPGFVAWCRAQGWQIVILTSRPIARYPNLYTDTLMWLAHNGMAADFVWWGTDKGEKLLAENVIPHVQFVVDDDARYVEQYARLGIRTYWLRNEASGQHPFIGDLYAVQTLQHIMEAEHVRRHGTSPAR